MLYTFEVLLPPFDNNTAILLAIAVIYYSIANYLNVVLIIKIIRIINYQSIVLTSFQ